MPRAAGRRRALFAVLAAALLGPVGAVAGWPGRGGAAQPPGHLTFRGHGFGHGIGMSQYGAYGMALRGVSAGRILAFYYGGAAVGRAALPWSLRVGLLQANRDPNTGGRLGQVLVQGQEVPGHGGGGRILVSGLARSGPHWRGLLGHVTYAVRPDRGGISLFAGAQRVYGPTQPGAGVRIHYDSPSHATRLLLPQSGQQLRFGRLEVDPVRDGATARPRAVAVLGFDAYLRGLAEMPSSWPPAALQAQAVAGRSYALASLLARGQHVGAGRWDGCDCAVYSDTRDQIFAGYTKEAGYWGARWVAAVRATSGRVVTWRGQVVRAFYSSSSGGYTSSNAQWGSPPLPCYPARPDPDDAARGRNPNASWRVTVTAAQARRALAGYGVGSVLSVSTRTVPSWGYRVAAVRIQGTARTVTLTGSRVRTLFHLKSTRFAVAGA